MVKNLEEMFHGSGGPDTPTSTSDNLFSEDVVEFALAISEGPIRGLTHGAKSFNVGETTLVAPDGTLNFQKFAIGVHPGYPEGVAKPLKLSLGGETSNQVVGIDLQSGVVVTRQTEPTLRNRIDQIEVRMNFARLVLQNDGGTFQHTALFALEYKPASSGSWTSFYPTSPISIRGKTTSGYVKEFRVDVPRINDDWMIRVVKYSPDSSENEAVELVWDSFQCTTKGNRAYPDVAIVHGVGVSTGQFSSLPEFSGVYDGILCRIPTNYNPDTRTYDDTTPWNGSFKFAWTNNPAWVLYELIVNQRFGLAAHRLHIDANRFDFYLAARWCDEQVPINNGPETRPRYTFNDVLYEPRPGMELLNYVAGSFNALVWDDLQGQIHLKVDKDDQAEMMFSPENVTAEGFSYTFTDTAVRANDISVSFINPDLDWNEDRRRIPGVTTNEEAIAKFGRIPLDFIAVGCTNVHEAIAKAQVRLISAQTETTMVSFSTTRQGQCLSLFDVILVADPTMGWSQSGRLTKYDDNFLYFRDAIFIEEMKSYTLKIQTASGLIETTVTPEQIGHVNRLQLPAPLPKHLPRYTVFTIEELDGFGYAKPFRVTALEEVDQYNFRISAIEINRNKYLLAETATPLTEFQYSYKTPGLPGAPTNFKAESGDDHLLVTSAGQLITRIFCSWRKPFAQVVSSFELQWRHAQDSTWQSKTVTGESEYIENVLPGETYFLRVAAVNHNGKKSQWATIADYAVVGKTATPANVTQFVATGGLFMNHLSWVYGTAADIKRVEIWGAIDGTFANAVKLTDLAYPTNKWTHLGLNLATTFYYWIRVFDTSGNPSEWSAVVSATTTAEPSQILDLLESQITESQLFGDLNSRIDLIDGPATLENSVAWRLAQEAEVRNAAIEYEAEVRANENEALAQSILTLSSTVDGNTSSIQTLASTTDGLSAKYTVKVDNNGYVSGYGLASTVNNGVPTSEFIVLADRFAVVTPGKTAKVPFVVGTVNGASVVGINGALVVDGTVAANAIDTRNLTIKDSLGNVILGAGTNLNINRITGLGSFATLNQITAANISTYLENAAIKTAHIAEANITTLNIAGEAIIAPRFALATSMVSSGNTADGITPGNWRTFLTLPAISLSGAIPGSVLLMLEFDFDNQYHTSEYTQTLLTISIARNGTQVASFNTVHNVASNGVVYLGHKSFNFTDTPGAGTFIYTARILVLGSSANYDAGHIYARTMIGMGAKR